MSSKANFFYRLRYLNRGFPVVIDGENFRFDESLRRWDFSSEMRVHRGLRKFLYPGCVFFDVGANFGQLAIPATGWVLPYGQVHAFEPVPRHLALLERHKGLNRLGAELRIVDAAVSNDRADHLDFQVPIDSVAVEAGLRIVSQTSRVQTVRVRNLRLDDYCQQTGANPHVIKIDVEGAELEVLRGAEQTLRYSRPVLLIEIHDFALHAFEADSTKLLEYLCEVGYGVSNVIQKNSGEKPWHQAIFVPV